MHRRVAFVRLRLMAATAGSERAAHEHGNEDGRGHDAQRHEQAASASPGGPEAPSPWASTESRMPEPLQVRRRVSVRGAIMTGGQRVQVGLPHASKTAEVTIKADT